MFEARQRIKKWNLQNDRYKTLDLSNLKLTELPPIPKTCMYLDCSNNKLTSLPYLLRYKQLKCQNNNLTQLPNHVYDADYIDCSNNKITSLPDLPECEYLNCNCNKLTFLPNLPSCYRLCCANNELTTLPDLPKLAEETYIRMYVDHELGPSSIDCFMNKYLYISKSQAQKYDLDETPNYTKCAKIIQRAYRRYLYNKHLKLYLVKNTIKIVCSYV
jgi:Leucine-rich repeat (LRR) protein